MSNCVILVHKSHFRNSFLLSFCHFKLIFNICCLHVFSAHNHLLLSFLPQTVSIRDQRSRVHLVVFSRFFVVFESFLSSIAEQRGNLRNLQGSVYRDGSSSETLWTVLDPECRLNRTSTVQQQLL